MTQFDSIYSEQKKVSLCKTQLNTQDTDQVAFAPSPQSSNWIVAHPVPHSSFAWGFRHEAKAAEV